MRTLLGSGLVFILRALALAGLGAYVVKLCSGLGSGLPQNPGTLGLLVYVVKAQVGLGPRPGPVLFI
jgi:hypothetical protein